MDRVVDLPRLPPRAPDSHKGTFGRVLVVAGSRGMVGAACLATEAVLRSGAGLVLLACPAGVQPLAAVKLTCAMTWPLPENADGALSEDGQKDILTLADRYDVVAIGPGLTQSPETMKLLFSTIPRLGKPLVVDADAINILSKDLTVLQRGGRTSVLTPHPGEMARLTRRSIDELQKNREAIAGEFAKKHRVVLLLKGHGSVVTDGTRLAVNGTGNPGMATAGSGDVLTGVVAGFLAQGLSPFDAARLAAHIHGLAGDIAAREIGPVGMLASDILDRVPKAIKALLAGQPTSAA
ncbi:MAG: NAD(P)H-hydrate dehydratase [Planctomycetota bacterium]